MIRYRKRIRILPFAWLNISKTGFSVSIGMRGLLLNIGQGGIYVSGAFLGTGLSIRKRIKKWKKREAPQD
jgi:hypothetical protein